MTITLDQAQRIITAAHQHGTEQGFNPLTVAVLDPGGAIVALGRQDGSGYLRPDLAVGKANGVLAAGEKIVFKVHMDDDDIREMCALTGAKQAVLFHSDAPATVNVKAMLAQDGREGLTIQYPERADV